MIKKPKNFWIIVFVFWFFLSGGLFLMIRKSLAPEPGFTPPLPGISGSELEPALEKSLKEILTRYFDAYKNAREKKNYEEIIKFFPKDLNESFNADPAKLEREITDIDDYEIKEIYKPGFAGEDQYAARVRIFKDGAPISPPTGDTWPVFLVKENGGFKVKTWFFNLPVPDR